MKINIILESLLLWVLKSKYKKRNLYLFAGLEPILRYQQQDKIWEIKTQECSRCGKCCMSINENHSLGTPDGCRHIEKQGNEFMCGLNVFRPFGCAIAEMDTIEECTVKWIPIK